MPTRKTPIPKHARCLICGCDLTAPVFDCPECTTPHHAMCWQWSGGCAVYGCRRAARAVREPERAAEIEAINSANRVRERVRTPRPDAAVPPPEPREETWVRWLVVLMFLFAGFATPPSPARAKPVVGETPAQRAIWHYQRSRKPVMEKLSASEQAANALLRDDREWEGTGNDPGPRLRRMMVAREGEALRSGVSRLATRPLPDWVRARVAALQRRL
jgi:hypothetical protein